MAKETDVDVDVDDDQGQDSDKVRLLDVERGSAGDVEQLAFQEVVEVDLDSD